MVSVDPSDLHEVQLAVRDAPRLHRRLSPWQAAILIILSIPAVCVPAVPTIVIDVYVGCLFLIDVMIGLAAVLPFRDMPASARSLMTAAFSVVTWRRPDLEVDHRCCVPHHRADRVFHRRGDLPGRDIDRLPRRVAGAWGQMLFSGLADLVFATVVIIGWPVTADWTVGVTVGINLITSGFAIVMTAIAGRDFVRPLTDDFRGMAPG
ncbi:MAG TPA: hypothetical protein VMD98_08455 [Bryocella sp.]|nr:hypothetical protein [Bryocella sp.]